MAYLKDILPKTKIEYTKSLNNDKVHFPTDLSRTQYRLVIKNKNLKPKKWVLWAIREQIFTSKNGERLNIDTKNPLDVIEKGDAKSLKKEFYNEYSSKIE